MVLHWLTPMTQMSWQEYSIYFLRFQREFYYLNDHYTFSIPQSSNSCHIYLLGLQNVYD
ncbi:hypothetical protein F383_36630 [Gossypium arboreum]|uniref:Uncharacterized protein n=1 Tax=Gossypium arboreum TaxID=29729 RepID=A0A0B0M9S2_GOSAR|nr:hypothetical protein F383_36630 [Gossypium arboreum]